MKHLFKKYFFVQNKPHTCQLQTFPFKKKKPFSLCQLPSSPTKVGDRPVFSPPSRSSGQPPAIAPLFQPVCFSAGRRAEAGNDASQGPGRAGLPGQVSGGQDRRPEEATAGAEQEESHGERTGPSAPQNSELLCFVTHVISSA